MTSAFEDPSRAAELFEVVIETSPYLYCVLDSDARFTFVSPASEPMLGYAPTELIGKVAFDFVHPDDIPVAAAALTQIVEEFAVRPGEGVPMALRLKHADGSLVDVEVGSAPMLDDQRVQGVIIRARPMSGQQFLDRALEALVASSPLEDVLDFLIASLNHELTRSHAALAYGWDGDCFRDVVRGGLPEVLCGGVGGAAAEPWAKAMVERDVTVHPTLSSLPTEVAAEAARHGFAALWIAPVRVRPNDPPISCLVIWRDVEGDPWVSHQASLARAVRLTALAFDRRHTEQLLRHAALHDTLTGVANRAQFFDRLRSLPTTEVRQHSRAAVLYLDLDGFKAVNDTYGHAAGDLVLQAVTDRMLGAVRSGDLVARLGGDEFAILCVDVANVDQATALADRLITATAQPIDVGPADVRVGVSIGIALASIDDAGSVSLLDAADRALYVAKNEGKSCWRLASSATFS